MWLVVDLRINTKKIVFERDWTNCSKNTNHSRLNNQNELGDSYNHLISTRLFTMIMKKIC